MAASIVEWIFWLSGKRSRYLYLRTRKPFCIDTGSHCILGSGPFAPAIRLLGNGQSWLFFLALCFGFQCCAGYVVLRVMCTVSKVHLRHPRFTTKSRIRNTYSGTGRMPIPDSSCDFIAPSGTVIQDWVTIKFPSPFGEYGQEERFYKTTKSEAFERACKDSPDVLGYCRVEPDAWKKATAQD
jgi:hypothetical protein